jgi:hypothetical protein
MADATTVVTKSLNNVLLLSKFEYRTPDEAVTRTTEVDRFTIPPVSVPILVYMLASDRLNGQVREASKKAQ